MFGGVHQVTSDAEISEFGLFGLGQFNSDVVFTTALESLDCEVVDRDFMIFFSFLLGEFAC